MIKNAKIERTMLGLEDHGIMTAFLHLTYGGEGQGFGGWALDTWSEAKKKRVATKFMGIFVAGCMDVVGVEKWEDLRGKPIRVDATNDKVLGIGNLLEEKWFYPERAFAEEKC